MLIGITECTMGVYCSHNQLLINIGEAGYNKRSQEMMTEMVKQRGGSICTMIHQYCIDNGAMIAQVGMFALQQGEMTKMKILGTSTHTGLELIKSRLYYGVMQ
jgi:N6-L-threonylcarbamoyladenine synthase